MVAKLEERCVVMRGAVDDKNRKCSIGLTVSFNRGFGLADGADGV